MAETVVDGLKWVKGEIAVALRRVRDLVETYGASGDPAGLKSAVDSLLEVRGVLLALQLNHPARLAEEMQRLADAMANGSVRSPRASAEAMMLALIQLPDHLDRLDAGVALPPLSLWSAINGLRECRGVPPLSQAELLVPESVLAEDSAEAPSPGALDALASDVRKVRPLFHRHLVEWYRPNTAADGLARLAALFQQFHRYLIDNVLSDLFRLAEAYTDALQVGQVADGPAARTLVGHLDRVFKPLVQDPPAWPKAEATVLIDEFLTALEGASMATPLVAELQARYRQTSADLVPPDEPNQALAGLAQAVLVELESVKDQLDRFVHGEQGDRPRLEEIRTTLGRLAQTLDVTPTGRLPARLRELADRFAELAEPDTGEGVLRAVPLAADLLGIEAELRVFAEHGRPARAGGDAAGLFATELSAATLREAQAELGHVKDAIQACQVPGERPGAFAHVPNRLANISGALQILGERSAAHLAEDIAALVQRQYLDPARWPVEGELGPLADAVAALEIYMERLLEGESQATALIARAGKSLGALDDLLSGSEPAVQPLEPAGELAFSETESLWQTDVVVRNEPPAAGAGPGLGSNGISPEFLDIFLEEAGEETQSVAEQLALWQADPADTSALTTLRRSFHTLKGSGRLVGAQRVGELAQSVEAALNRVIERSLEPGAELIALVAEAAHLLPDLIAAEAEGRPLPVDDLVLRINRLTDGGASESPTDVTPDTQTPPAEIVPWAAGDWHLTPPPRAASGPIEEIVLESTDDWTTSPWDDTPEQTAPDTGPVGLASVPEPAAITDHASLFAEDDELLDIFRSETREHLDTLHAFLQRAADGNRVPDESAVRALHTLTGSARMSGVDSIAGVTKPLELRLREHLTPVSAAPEDLIGLLRAAVDAIALRIAEIPATGPGAAALTALAGGLTVPATGLPEPAVVAGPSAPEGEPPSPEGEVSPLAAELERALASWSPDWAADQSEGPGFQLAEPTATDLEPGPETLDEAEPEAGARLEPEPETSGTLRDEPGFVTAAEPEPALEDFTGIEPEPAADYAAGRDYAAGPVPERETSQAVASENSTDFEMPPDDPELKTLFLEDARDLLDGIDARIREWQFAPQELGVLDGINRLLHTLKGSARLTGLTAIGDLSHALETRLIAVAGAPGAVDDTTLELTQKAADTLSIQVDALEQGALLPRARALVEALSQPPEAAAAGGAAEPDLAVMRPAVEPSTGTGDTTPAPSGAATGAREGTGARSGAPQIRVGSDLLDRLVDNSGEISLYRARLAQRNGLLGFGLGELDQTVARLREQLRLLEIETEAQILHRVEREGLAGEDGALFDPLELDRFSTLQQLSRALAETVNDLVSLKDLLGGYQRESSDLLTQQARLADNLQDGLLRTRMVPFVQLVPRLHRLVRQTADSLGKSARLEVIGPEVELDRSILDRLAAPLEHLLRNAVDHGLEDPEERVRAGKPAAGVITLALSREGNDVVLDLRDDGRGLDLVAIRSKAVTRGLLAPQATLPDATLMQFVFEPGFTTSGRVTQISGRGVGLDVVASEIKAANGSIALESTAGQGTRFVMRLPLTLAIIDAFLVSAGDTVYAVPYTTIEGAARIARDELAAAYRGKGRDFEYRGHSYRIAYLGGVLDPRQKPELGERRWLPLLLARLGDLRVALQVDNLIESGRVVVKPLGPQLAGVRWLSGGTILPDGRVALILDVLALLRSGAVQDYRPADTLVAGGTPAPVCVMVVDDSLTVRRVTSRLLRRQNMEVLTAKDGVEALTLLDERRPDVLLLDIEMPRMDGYELTRHVRRSPRLKDLPIIMITSRTGEKHREHAQSLGVNRYLGKPYQESELLGEISSVLMENRR